MPYRSATTPKMNVCRTRFRRAISLLPIALMAGPLSLALTLVLNPFWSWIEFRLGIEAIGHSGPAGWCYLVAYFGVVLALCGCLRRRI